uniref:ShKT domain-containing protein n=1 Tax=Meloidogyne floridensis TaxID=298350 RepID=A0A915NME5_9BILA
LKLTSNPANIDPTPQLPINQTLQDQIHSRALSGRKRQLLDNLGPGLEITSTNMQQLQPQPPRQIVHGLFQPHQFQPGPSQPHQFLPHQFQPGPSQPHQFLPHQFQPGPSQPHQFQPHQFLSGPSHNNSLHNKHHMIQITLQEMMQMKTIQILVMEILGDNGVFGRIKVDIGGFGGNKINSGKECADKNFPGRPSDCPMLKYLCERPLYKDIMSRECPRTCDSCDLFKINLCSDNISPNGISECPKFKERCNDKIWGDLMKKECRLTCGTCNLWNMKIKKEKIGAGKYLYFT